LKEISERLASWFPQTRMSQGFWWCLVAVSEGNRGNHLRVINGAGQACFESPQSMKRNFRPFKNRTAVTKEERIRQRRNCAAIDKDRAAWLRGANDNFLITVRLFGSFPLLFTVCFAVTKEADIMPKRRANGEGNIRKRKDGRWEGRYTVGHDPETGKAIIKNVLGKTQAEVKEKLKKAIEENVGIDYGRAKTYTVGNWLEVWYENYAKIKMRPSTYLTYHGYIENHIKPQLGKIPLNDLTTLHLQQFYKKLLAEGRVERIEAQKQPKGLSAKTVRNIHQIISSALKLAAEQRLIAHNPADGCALPKAERKEMQTLPVEQLTSFLREAKDSGVFALYYIDLITGLRRGELLGLKWSDIDLKKGDLRVQRQIGRIDGKIIEMPLKTKNAYRTLPLSADAIDVLKMQKCKVGNSEWVFPSPSGGPMSPDSVLHMLQRVLKRAGLPRIRFHDLRHPYVKHTIKNKSLQKQKSQAIKEF
jgi:integrase